MPGSDSSRGGQVLCISGAEPRLGNKAFLQVKETPEENLIDQRRTGNLFRIGRRLMRATHYRLL
jgi:hypothetical protein